MELTANEDGLPLALRRQRGGRHADADASSDASSDANSDASSEGEEVVSLAARLIAAPSPNPPGDERAVANVVRELLREHHLPAPRVLARSKKRPNLLSSVRFGRGGRHLCLAAHLDTKPVGSAPWSSDPLRPVVIGDRLVGLGAVDMKGALAAMILAAERLVLDPPPAGRLSLLFTADEEDGAAWGAHYVASLGTLHADGVAIGEPGGLERDYDRLHLGSRGIARLRIEVAGDQSHASLSDRSGAVNASLELAKLLVALSEQFTPTSPPAPGTIDGWRTTVTPGVRLAGGVGFGVVPGSAVAEVDVRVLPGMTRAGLERDLDGFLAGLKQRDDRLRARVLFDDPPKDWLDATAVAVDDPLAVAARQALREVLGAVPPDCLLPGTTDAASLQGVAGIPTLPALGPGLLARAHGADEWVSIGALARAVRIYESLARAYCG